MLSILLLEVNVKFNMLDPLPLRQFRTRFNSHKSRVNAHVNQSSESKRKDDVLYQHFHSQGHLGLEHMSVQLIDWVKGERELRDKEGQWIYKLGTLLPHGLNDDGFYAQNKKARMSASARV